MEEPKYDEPIVISIINNNWEPIDGLMSLLKYFCKNYYHLQKESLDSCLQLHHEQESGPSFQDFEQ